MIASVGVIRPFLSVLAARQARLMSHFRYTGSLLQWIGSMNNSQERAKQVLQEELRKRRGITKPLPDRSQHVRDKVNEIFA